MRDTGKSPGRGAAFLSGIIIGGAVGAAAVFLLAVPSGKRILANMKDESVSLKGKSSDLIKSVRQKSIDLKRAWVSDKRLEKEQMIPIPKDYV